MKTREKYKLYKPKKFLGQNFLVDDNIARKIIKHFELKSSDTVLEIGPGRGALTKHLAGFCKKYYGIEIDKSIADSLKIKYGDKGKIINEDFLEYDLNKFKKPIKIIGNLPYNIASEILFKLFEHNKKIISAVLMVQKEFAKRIIAKPNSKEYGILSVQSQVFSKPEILFNVPPTVFFPKPKVQSSVIKLDFQNLDTSLISKECFKEVVRTAFGKRRKTLKNSLKELFEELNLDFDDLDLFFDFSVRAESLSVQDFVQLSNLIFNRVC